MGETRANTRRGFRSGLALGLVLTGLSAFCPVLAADIAPTPPTEKPQPSNPGLRSSAQSAFYGKDQAALAFIVQNENAQSWPALHDKKTGLYRMVHAFGSKLAVWKHHAAKKTLQRSIRYGQSETRWHAYVGAGSRAMVLIPGEAKNLDGLHLQRRQAVGEAQLGMVRNIGKGRVTLGYLRYKNKRPDLMRPDISAARQDYAALTLSFRQ